MYKWVNEQVRTRAGAKSVHKAWKTVQTVRKFMNIRFMFNGCERVFLQIQETNERVLRLCVRVEVCVCVSFSFAVHLVKTYNTNNKCTLICVNRHKIACVRFFWLSLVCTQTHHFRFGSFIRKLCPCVRACVHSCMLVCPLREQKWLRKLRKLSANSFWPFSVRIYCAASRAHTHTLTISLVVVNAVEIVVIIRLQLNMICYGGILWPKNGVT